ncbi:hypothetical protein BEL04_08200 [Mucilaginibacter sp. PPCGB 2223]|uniref:hypothetical protein n=1 Tax=Mucilaginibacter sp. PPCGB 2223 TaxID=1886027 RepID=UPI000825F260|nr:hypothetical protein [Mucilaginibacter sp. PPCGB 2223]OCX54230.1 hypothetical protein BEL04_08200 [Mucilaginibacter sp. PPCGB 2223]
MSVKNDCWDVAHAWANHQDGSGIGAGGNMLYGSSCVYSYGDHFMIARHVKNDKGERAVLFTERTYSQTTAKHIAIVRNASSHLNLIHVADPALNKEELFNDWQERMISVAEKLADAKRPQKYATEIEKLYHEAERYADFFGYEMPELLVMAGNIRNSETFMAYLTKDRAEREAEKAEESERLKKLHAQRLKDWRAFKSNGTGSLDGWDYLRFLEQTCEVETTQRVIFTLFDAKALYRFIKDTIAKGSYSENSEQFLGYDIIEINKAYVRIGCHKVALKEINRFADQQGWR